MAALLAAAQRTGTALYDLSGVFPGSQIETAAEFPSRFLATTVPSFFWFGSLVGADFSAPSELLEHSRGMISHRTELTVAPIDESLRTGISSKQEAFFS